MMRIAPLVLMLGLAAGAAAQDTERPACDQARRGQLWPSGANQDRTALKQALHCGELKICSRGLWKFRWEAVGVPMWQLAGQQAPAACQLNSQNVEPDSAETSTR